MCIITKITINMCINTNYIKLQEAPLSPLNLYLVFLYAMYMIPVRHVQPSIRGVHEFQPWGSACIQQICMQVTP